MFHTVHVLVTMDIRGGGGGGGYSSWAECIYVATHRSGGGKLNR